MIQDSECPSYTDQLSLLHLHERIEDVKTEFVPIGASAHGKRQPLTKLQFHVPEKFQMDEQNLDIRETEGRSGQSYNLLAAICRTMFEEIRHKNSSILDS